MPAFQILLILTLAIISIVLVIFIVKSISTPKKISTIKNYLRQGKIQKAIKVAKAMIVKDNRDIVAHYYLGKAYLADKKDELALMEFKIVNREAIFESMDIPEKEFRQLCGNLHKSFNQVDDALNEYILLSKMEPHNANFLFETAELFAAKQKFEHALGYYNKSLQIQPKNGKAHSARGRLLFKAKQYAEAKKAIELAIKLNPEIFQSYYYLGKILKESHEYQSALDAFEKATRDPDLRQKAIVERGMCYVMVKSYEKAKVEFNRVISMAKEDSSELLYARYFLAHCFEKERKIEKAIEQWNLIHKRNKSFRDVPTKLIEYRTFNDNDNMKEYLTCSDDSFKEMCKKILTNALGFSAQTTVSKKFGCEIVATETKNTDWREVRKALHFFVFYRDITLIDDTVIRTLLDVAKKQNYVKVYLLTSSDFSRVAVNFAENRPIELINKQKLQKLLEKIGT